MTSPLHVADTMTNEIDEITPAPPRGDVRTPYAETGGISRDELDLVIRDAEEEYKKPKGIIMSLF